MVELIINLSEDLKEKMQELPEVDWNMVVSAFIREKILEWARLRSIAGRSELTEEDALELGRLVNKGLAKKYKESVSLK